MAGPKKKPHSESLSEQAAQHLRNRFTRRTVISFRCIILPFTYYGGQGWLCFLSPAPCLRLGARMIRMRRRIIRIGITVVDTVAAKQ